VQIAVIPTEKDGEKDTMSDTDAQNVEGQSIKQESLSKWQKQKDLLQEYSKKVGLKEEYITSDKIHRNKSKCSWCDRFKEHEFLYCLNCGRVIR